MGGSRHDQAAARPDIGCFAEAGFRQMHAIRANFAGEGNISGNQQEKTAFACHLAERQSLFAPLSGLARSHDHHTAFGQKLCRSHGIGEAGVIRHQDQRRQFGMRRSCQPYRRPCNILA